MKRISVFVRLAAIAAASALLVQATDASAVGTRTFRLDTLDDLKGGELEGTSVDSLGHVRAGFVLGSLPLPGASAVWCSLVMPDGAVLLGTGNDGKVFQVRGGQVSEYANTGQLAVTALSLDGNGKVIAGTIPNGKLFVLEGAGKQKELVNLPDTEHVWDLVLDPKSKAVFAATGPNGKLFRVDANGAAQVYFDSDEAHLISVAVGPDGSVYTGSSGNAILYRLQGPGRATVMYDFPGTDVKGIAFAPDGRMYAIANEHTIPPTVPTSSRSNATSTAEPTKASKAAPKPGKGRLYRFSSSGQVEELLYDKDTHFQSLAIGDDGLPYVGTAKDGEVYAVDDAHTSMLMADTEERQIGAMVLSGRTRFVASSDPAVFHPLRSIGGPDSVWNSKVLDAGLRASFGRLTWRATGPVELSTRTGNTEKPDTTWTSWSQPLTGPGKVSSPAGRYIQVRARFSRDPSAVLREILLHFVTDNARAVVTSINTGEASSDTKKSDSIPASGGELGKAESKVKLSWKVENPDSDQLRYRLFFRFEGSSVWRPMLPTEEVLSKTSYDWDTSGLAEGTYRVKVEASDELSNPPGSVQRHSLESGTVLVDNTPPVFRQLTVGGQRIRGSVVDGVGPIARIEVSVDPNPSLWIPFFPTDGIFDDPTENFDLDVSSLLGGGSRLVAVKASDAAGNSVVRTVEVK